MAEVVTTEGLEWFADKSLDVHDEVLDVLAVGDGTSTATQSDTSLDNELYRGSRTSENINIERTSNTGEIVCRITVTGGTEVPAGSSLTEFALFSDRTNTMIYRQNRSGINIPSGESKAFEWTIQLTEK